MSASSPYTRRRFLGRAAQAASFAAAAAWMPPNVQKLLAASPSRTGSLGDIKHVVFLMQENRSFDHYFGTLAGVRGFDDPKALRLPDGRTVFHQPDVESPDGYMLPFHLDTVSTNAQAVPQTGHSWEFQHQSWNGGLMDQWLPAHRAAVGPVGAYTMGYYKRDDIPFHFALADAFTVCDAYHCSVMASTRPNRLFYMSGTNDPDGRAGGPVIRNRIVPGQMHWTTYPERLEAAGISWRVYQETDTDDGFNVLRGFRQFIDAPAGSSLRRRGMPEAREGMFERDVRLDRLPTVSWICPTLEACEHPRHLPAAGADFIARKLDALASNPDVWAKTAFILHYDENDGFFDHVPPPVPAEGTPGEFIDGLPIGGGFRVPCIIISPWTTGGWVCSQPFDHTSTLRFLERLTGVRETNISDWRRRTFGDLTAAFQFDRPAAALPALPSTGEPFLRARHAVATLPDPPFPGKHQPVPRQEEGTRRRTPHEG